MIIYIYIYMTIPTGNIAFQLCSQVSTFKIYHRVFGGRAQMVHSKPLRTGFGNFDWIYLNLVCQNLCLVSTYHEKEKLIPKSSATALNNLTASKLPFSPSHRVVANLPGDVDNVDSSRLIQTFRNLCMPLHASACPCNINSYNSSQPRCHAACSRGQRPIWCTSSPDHQRFGADWWSSTRRKLWFPCQNHSPRSSWPWWQWPLPGNNREVWTKHWSFSCFCALTSRKTPGCRRMEAAHL